MNKNISPTTWRRQERFTEQDLRLMRLFAATEDGSYVELQHWRDVELAVEWFARDAFGRNMLHYANHPRVAALLLAIGLDPNLQDKHGQTPLHRVNDTRTAHRLIANGADLTIADRKNCRAIVALSDKGIQYADLSRHIGRTNARRDRAKAS